MNIKKPSILVVGSINMDLMTYNVPKIPTYGESVLCGNYAFYTGGKGANQAVAVAMQGGDVTMVGKIGNDDNGKIVLNALNEFGIDSSFISVDENAQTGFAQIMVNEDGRYFSCIVLGGNNNIDFQDVENAIKNKKFEMILIQLEMSLEIVYKTFELAKSLNIPVFLDAGPAMKIPFDRLKGLFILSPNEAEAEALTGIKIESIEDAEKVAKILFEEAIPTYIVLKLGEKGAYVYDGTNGKLIKGFKVCAVDSTAAGDTFGATLAVQLCKGVDIEKAIVIANASGALCVSKKGAQSSIPTETEVFEFLKNHTTS